MARYLPFKIKIAVFFTAALFWDCGNPLEPAAPAWERYANFPGGLSVNTVCYSDFDRAVFGSGSYAGKKTVIFKYENPNFSIEYTSPYKGATIDDISFRYGYGWAGGAKTNGDTQEPYLLYYDYNEEYWHEITIPETLGMGIVRVFPINSNSCWLLLGREYSKPPAQRTGLLVKYDRNKIDVFTKLGEVSVVYYDDRRQINGGGIIYAVSNINGKANVYISNNGGDSWEEETMEFTLPSGRKVVSARAGFAICNDLYLIADLEHYNFTGIIKRSGDIRRGRYELVFLANVGPNFVNIVDIAFQEGSFPRTGIAVGDRTSVLFHKPDWLLEEFTYPVEFTRVITPPGEGFLALARNRLFMHNYELFYHR